MRVVTLGPEFLGSISLDEGFERMFSSETLKKIHGADVKYSEWNNEGKRKVQFSIAVDNIPMEIRRFFCGKTLRITNNQIKEKPADNHYVVKNKMRMHFLGAEMFKIKPTFAVMKDESGTHALAHIEHHAILPPPLNMIAEHFMAAQTQREMEYYRSVLGVAPPHPLPEQRSEK